MEGKVDAADESDYSHLIIMGGFVLFEDDKQVIVVVEEKERERMEGQLRLGGKKIADHPSHVDSTVQVHVLFPLVLRMYLCSSVCTACILRADTGRWQGGWGMNHRNSWRRCTLITSNTLTKRRRNISNNCKYNRDLTDISDI